MNIRNNILVTAAAFLAACAQRTSQTTKEIPMFTLEQIKTAHAKVKSGVDFPSYAKELKALGLSRYEFYLMDGHAEYYGQNGQKLVSEPKWEPREIGPVATQRMEEALALHQKGGSDFPTITMEAARYGVYKWIVDFMAMTCTYYAEDGRIMIVEAIPQS